MPTTLTITDGVVIFRGKLDYYSYAKDEGITVIFPQGVQAGNTALAYWQWTVDSQGNLKPNTNYQGIIDIIKIEASDSRVVGFTDRNYYRFDGELSKDGLTLKLTMTSIKDNKSSLMTLSQVYRT